MLVVVLGLATDDVQIGIEVKPRAACLTLWIGTATDFGILSGDAEVGVLQLSMEFANEVGRDICMLSALAGHGVDIAIEEEMPAIYLSVLLGVLGGSISFK